MKNLCIFCSTKSLPDDYTQPAAELAFLLAKNGWNLVWGGSYTGLMKIVADSARAGGAKLTGISMELVKDSVYQDADEVLIEKDLTARKAAMLGRSDAFLAMVGGIGTLDEVTEILELKKHSVHTKPILFLNTNHFYDGLQKQLEKMKSEGFIQKPLAELITFAETPQEVIAHLQSIS